MKHTKLGNRQAKRANETAKLWETESVGKNGPCNILFEFMRFYLVDAYFFLLLLLLFRTIRDCHSISFYTSLRILTIPQPIINKRNRIVTSAHWLLDRSLFTIVLNEFFLHRNSHREQFFFFVPFFIAPLLLCLYAYIYMTLKRMWINLHWRKKL